MSQVHRLISASEQLDRLLSFFPRLESKSTAVLGINVAMIGFLGVNAPNFQFWTWPMLVAIAPLSLLGVSIYYVYLCSFPHLEGGHDSLIYFREIAKRTESQYIEQFSNRSEDEQINDTLGQVWRNSEILRLKFDAIRQAHIWLVTSIIPWITGLLVFASLSHPGRLFH